MKKKSIRIAVGLGLAQFALFTSGALAQDTTRNVLKTNSLEQVVVTATRSPKRKAEIGKVVRIITSEQLERSQGRNLPEVLNNVAGITYSGANNAFSNNATSLFLRGATAGNTLILIDGIPVNDAQSISNEYDLKSIAIDQIERVEILKGGNSTLYGSDAVAGVINVITKKPSKEAFNANVLLSAGSYQSNKQAIGLNGTSGKTGLAFNYSHTGSKEFSSATDAVGTGNFDKDGFDQHAVNFNGKQQISERITVNGNIQLSNNNGMSDGGSFVDDADYTYKRTHFFGGVTGKYLLNKGGITLNLSSNSVINKFFNSSEDGSALQRIDNKGRIWQADLFVNNVITNFLELNSGVNYRKANSDQYSLYDSPGYTSESPLSSSLANAEISSFFTSVFLKNLGGFHFELGGRYNEHSRYGGNFTYTINPSYIIANKYKIFVNASSAFKAPTLYQLFSEYGNTELKPEVTQTYDAGFDLDIIPNVLNFNATAFQRITNNDAIYFYSDPVTFNGQYRNGRKQNDQGLELELSIKPMAELSFNSFYSFVKGELTIDENTKQKDLYRRPKNQFGGSLTYQPVQKMSLGIIAKYTGSRKEQDFRDYPATIMTHKAYTLIDTYISVSPSRKVTLFGDFKNILNTDYTEWVGYNTRGFNFNAGIKYTVR
ncbi:TonB-dependent receptor [Pedobacter sp. P351]|uniref:TonB-dependent receptor plug domain-containing protein n=1 Tax=Pedobacter superstes TaxID=3133441 RepID=UPI0030B5EF26